MTIKLNSIIPAPWNARTAITPESVAELAASIEAQGLLQPIVLWRPQADDGKLVCIAGNRRLAALVKLGKELEDGDWVQFIGNEAEARAVTITENLQRENLGIIEESKAVDALLTLGKSPTTVAASLGRSAAWVRRRAKVATLDEAWVKRAGEVEADALEHIAAYPAEIQRRVAKRMGSFGTKWSQFKAAFDGESRDLDEAKFDTKPCRACLKRTGAEADLFGVCDGKLGRCLDCECYEARREAWLEAAVKKAVGNAETVRVDYYWQMPSDEETSDKRTKKHPCAYVSVEDDGEVKVRWGESKAEREARRKAEDAKRDAERMEAAKEREREDEITDKLDEWSRSGKDGEWPSGLMGAVVKRLAEGLETVDREAFDFCANAIGEAVMNCSFGREWAEAVKALPEIAEAAGVSEDDAQYLVGRYADGKEEE